MAWAATERVCWCLISAVHVGILCLGVRRFVRIEGDRIEEELGPARGNERSILSAYSANGLLYQKHDDALGF